MCIYCLRSLDAAKFTTDHVMPRQMGRFRHNLTLLDAVCGDCNQYFGDAVEPHLAYGSFEAILRLNARIRPASRAARLRGGDIEVRWPNADQWQGLRFRLWHAGDELVLQYLPQAGFQQRGRPRRVWLSVRQLADPAFALPEDTLTRDVVVFADSDETSDAVVEALRRRGIPLTPQRTIDLPFPNGAPLTVQIETHITETILRAVAKIAFNYLAFHHPRMAVRADFEAIRAYIRHGPVPRPHAVTFDSRPVLADDAPRLRQTHGHLVTLNWDRTRLLGQVALFNELRYQVELCRHYGGLWVPIAAGHHFDHQRHEITPLIGAARGLLP